MSGNNTPPILERFAEEYFAVLDDVRESINTILSAIDENPEDVTNKIEVLSSERPEIAEALDKVAALIESSDDHGATFIEWYRSSFHNHATADQFLSQWLNHIVLPNADAGKKTVAHNRVRRKKYSEQRKEEWAKYGPWLDDYFGRNPSLSLTDGRRACGREFGVSRKTISRRTKGYKKPTN